MKFKPVVCPNCSGHSLTKISINGRPYAYCIDCKSYYEMSLAMRKVLRCPKCGARIIDADDNTQAEMCISTEKEKDLYADFYEKCKVCKSDVGIKKITLKVTN